MSKTGLRSVVAACFDVAIIVEKVVRTKTSVCEKWKNVIGKWISFGLPCIETGCTSNRICKDPRSQTKPVICTCLLFQRQDTTKISLVSYAFPLIAYCRLQTISKGQAGQLTAKIITALLNLFLAHCVCCKITDTTPALHDSEFSWSVCFLL